MKRMPRSAHHRNVRLTRTHRVEQQMVRTAISIGTRENSVSVTPTASSIHCSLACNGQARVPNCLPRSPVRHDFDAVGGGTHSADPQASAIALGGFRQFMQSTNNSINHPYSADATNSAREVAEGLSLVENEAVAEVDAPSVRVIAHH